MPCIMMTTWPNSLLFLLVETKNVGTMKERSAEVADMLERQRVDQQGGGMKRFSMISEGQGWRRGYLRGVKIKCKDVVEYAVRELGNKALCVAVGNGG